MPLSKGDVVDAALRVVDEYGLADLTMRRLGAALGVRAGALYHHVPSKQALLALIADRVLSDAPAPLGTWRPALAAWADGLRDALLVHRDSAEIVSTARAMGLLGTDPLRHPVTVLTATGLGTADARGAAATILTFVLGHVVEEQARADWERFGKPEAGTPPTADAGTFRIGTSIILDGIGAQF